MKERKKEIVKFELKLCRKNIPDTELINDLKRVARELGKGTVKTTEYKRSGKFSVATFGSRFCSWYRALERAGLHKSSNRNITNEELFQNLKEVWHKLGRQPGRDYMRAPVSKYSATTYAERFGTWNKALERFVEFANGEKLQGDSRGESGEIHNGRRKKRNISWRLRFLVMRRDNFKCRFCGASPATDQSVVLQVDHIKPWCCDGKTAAQNLQTLCSKCNIGKGDLQQRSDVRKR
jgi:hypothetical protein